MIPLAAIRTNKYRQIETYKLSESKIEALIQSYATSGFWDGSIQARPHPTEAGRLKLPLAITGSKPRSGPESM
jgi:hypothetical protein